MHCLGSDRERGLGIDAIPRASRTVATLGQFALIAALLGTLVVAVGSALVIVGIKGWLLAGLYTMSGNALIGLWLLAAGVLGFLVAAIGSHAAVDVAAVLHSAESTVQRPPRSANGDER